MVQIKKAIKLLKDNGFKIVCHLMPDLPGSSPELDLCMFKNMITDPDLQCDDVKIYPTAICKSSRSDLIITSEINEWYEKGIYKPYSETDITSLMQVIIWYKNNVSYYTRIQRIIRDIPHTCIKAGYNHNTSMRDILAKNSHCRCIRCKEVKNNDLSNYTILPTVQSYRSSGGTEYFIIFGAYQNNLFIKLCYLFYNFMLYLGIIYYYHHKYEHNYIIGFCRMRINDNNDTVVFDELKNAAIVRELHVYSAVADINIITKDKSSEQHKGYGHKLMLIAENIVKRKGLKNIAVISGIGVQEYYKNKLGYKLGDNYMMRFLGKSSQK